MSKSNISKVQRLQNAAARLIYGRRKRDGVHDLLKILHWLPVEQRIYFKVILMVFKCLHSMAPVYLCDCIILLNDEDMLVHMPQFNSSYGDRSFSHCGPRLWNSLPRRLRIIATVDRFKSMVKNYLFENFSTYLQCIDKYRQ